MHNNSVYLVVVIVAFVITIFTYFAYEYNTIVLSIIVQFATICGASIYYISFHKNSNETNLSSFGKKVLPLWHSHLNHSMNDTDKHLMSIAKNLDLILNDIKAIKTSYFMDNSQNSSTAIFDTSKTNLQNIISTLKESINAKNTLIEQVEDVSKSLVSIDKFIDRIASFSMQIRVLSTNALIIASRIAGEHGSAFAVVADEMCQFSNKVDDISKELYAIISDFKIKYNSSQVEIKDKIVKDIKTVSVLENEITNTMTRLQTFSSDIVKANSVLEKSTHNIDNTIQNSLYMLQFHDRVGQILTHLADEMQDLTSRFQSKEYNLNIDEYLKEVSNKYTTSEQLKGHHKGELKDEVINNGDIVFL